MGTVTPQSLRDVLALARNRFAAGEGASIRAATGVDLAAFVATCAPGYLPAGFPDALPRAQRSAWAKLGVDNTVVLAATDEAGVDVDALFIRSDGQTVGLHAEPRGLLGARLVTTTDHLIVVDTHVAWLDLFRQSLYQTVLLRGLADAQHNAARMFASGIRTVDLRVQRDADAITAALLAAGILVTANNAPVAAPALAPSAPASAAVAAPALGDGLEEERDGQTAIYRAGPVAFVVGLRDDGQTTRTLIVRAKGRSWNHEHDLAAAVGRERAAPNIAKQVGWPVADVVAHLARIWQLVQAYEAQRDAMPAVAVSAADRAMGFAVLDAPDLLDQICDDYTALGWPGERNAKQVLYLAGISRFLPQPVSAVYQANAGAAPWQGIGLIAACTPPESRTVFRHLTASTLALTDPKRLRHGLVILDQAETLRPEAALTLRVLREQGGVGWTGTTARGSVAVLAAATGALDPRCRDGFLTVTVDESPDQTAAILAEQRRRLAGGHASADTTAILARHHAAQRLLQPLPVIIPFVDRIIFPASRLRHRDEHAWFLGLVAASALLHQRQRQREDGAIVASEADFNRVVAITSGLLGATGAGLSPAAERLLQTLWAQRLTRFTMPVLGGLFPDWTRWTFRAALQDLMDAGHVTSAAEPQRGGRGQCRAFTLSGDGPPALAVGIRLRPLDAAPPLDAETGKLAETGGIAAASFTPVRTGT